MNIKCGGCAKEYIIPDDRLPKDKPRFAFPCPACKEIIHAEIPPAAAEDKAPSDTLTDRQSIEKLKAQIISKLGDLPPMSRVLFKARDVMANPDLGAKDLANVIEKDPAMAAKVLRVANSAYYGLSGTVSSIQHATVLLGAKRVGEVITMAGASRIIDKPLAGYGMQSGELWEHSLAVGFASRMLIQKRNPGLASDAFVAGLIHDIGKMILDPYLLKYNQQFMQAIQDGLSYTEAEAKTLGIDHPEIGYEACVAWGIPEELRSAIRFHHAPLASENRELAYAVNLADAIAIMSGIGDSHQRLHYQIDPNVIDALCLTEEDILFVLTQTVESVQKVEEDILGV